jgi:tRNA(fMet)-specific endonuclease VapC
LSKDVIVEDRWCLDTDVLIDVSRKKAAAIAFLEQKEKEGEVCCSVVSEFEMLSGARNKKEQKTIVDFFNRFTILAIDDTVSWQALDWYMQYHLSHGTGFLDCLIAATAFQYSLPIYTLNTKHFKILPGLDLRRPY